MLISRYMIYYDDSSALWLFMCLLFTLAYQLARYEIPPLIPFSMNWNMLMSVRSSNLISVIFKIASQDLPRNNNMRQVCNNVNRTFWMFQIQQQAEAYLTSNIDHDIHPLYRDWMRCTLRFPFVFKNTNPSSFSVLLNVDIRRFARRKEITSTAHASCNKVSLLYLR